MTGELLDVSQRPADRRYLPGRVNVRPSAVVARATDEAEVSVPPLEHVHDRLRRRGLRTLGLDDERASVAHVRRAPRANYFVPVFDQCMPNVFVQGMRRPDLPLMAEFSTQISPPICPSELFVIPQVSFAISLTLSGLGRRQVDSAPGTGWSTGRPASRRPGPC